jgi:hypothetical protein
VHIGNFVEIKNSVFAAHAKANHLAYVGDADVGQRVNIGAGTITCNYDGANKWRTVIEDDVFIGSDTQLVAPVRVGKGATLGAGTTLTRDAPAGKLTVSRAKQAGSGESEEVKISVRLCRGLAASRQAIAPKPDFASFRLSPWATPAQERHLKVPHHVWHRTAIARRNIVPVLIEGLRKLEYRGYDSAGLAVLKDGTPQLQRLRAVGRVAELAAQADARSA